MKGSFVVALVSSLVACSEGLITYIELDAGDGGGSPDAGADAGDEDADVPNTDGVVDCDFQCLGDCAPFRPGDFSLPVLAYVGPNDGTAPDCPDTAPVEQFVWHDDIQIPPKPCGPCSCGPSIGACSLPSSVTAHAAPCTPPEGTIATPTNPPEAWEGSCTAEGAIPEDLACGGSLPCVQSITIGPLAITDELCVPVDGAESPTQSSTVPTWGIIARVCEGSAFGQCLADEHCVPAPVGDYQQCVQRLGIHDCPAEEYTVRHVLFEAFQDERVCTPCTCGTPSGSYCKANLSFYPDGSCNEAPLTASASSLKSTCFDVNPSGQAIAAKSATVPTYHAGICQASGGELSGDVQLLGPRTLCCRP
ncbi:hypothetical protein [Polyangium fumosum]|uniref:Uncharacterized protein n=1 Tax=Polyangium fumosum TaxID=889272 RepID=A0A4U1IAH7_9BACT|nr:hypothetical protein [Polyangium fumosum]TKC90554.1 hypothetical protein E8A74_50985 [Polyangium fumosum]